jgi:hypothetical protein
LRGVWILGGVFDVVCDDGALVFGLGIARQLGWLTATPNAPEPASAQRLGGSLALGVPVSDAHNGPNNEDDDERDGQKH